MAEPPLAALAKAREQLGGTAVRYEYAPNATSRYPGGDLDDEGTLARVIPSAASGDEVMLLCVGGAGAMRGGANLVLNLAALGLRHMLLFAPERRICEGIWEVLPKVACVWQPSAFRRERPLSLYNHGQRLFGMREFNPVALNMFKARKLLLERLVLSHRLNVLHLDADVVAFANPYPVFKGPLARHALIFQSDGPFANAGVFYVQHVARGDGAAWVLQELNRRIDRFTNRPASVAELPNSAWSAPPHFANADEQANLNDVLASSLLARLTYTAGVEFYEARFKRQFAPRRCNGGHAGVRLVASGDAECRSVVEARKRMEDARWTARMVHHDTRQAKGTMRAERRLRAADEALTHLCSAREWVGASSGELRVPGDASAGRTSAGRTSVSSVYLAPQALFAHFPYGSFFPARRQCHGSAWAWASYSAVERRMCAPEHRVPALVVHMAGLRQEQWGRRALIRALGAWFPAADAVAPEAWVSARSDDAARARTPRARRHAWAAVGRLLLTEGVPTGSFGSMGEYDRFAARLLLLGLLTRRRVVLPPIPCELRWMRRALEPRHLRGMEVGCGAERQCVWLPYPHHVDALCAGVDYLHDYEYRELLALRRVAPAGAAARAPLASLRLVRNGSAGIDAGGGILDFASAAHSTAPVLTIVAQHGSSADPLGWLPLGGFKSNDWRAELPRRVEARLRASYPAGFGASEQQMRIVRQCLTSLARSTE